MGKEMFVLDDDDGEDRMQAMNTKVVKKDRKLIAFLKLFSLVMDFPFCGHKNM